MAEYVVLVDSLTKRTSKPSDPFTFTRHAKGTKVTLDDAEEARRLVEAGAIVETKDSKEALESRGALTEEVIPGTDGGAGFNGDVHSTPEAEAARVQLTADLLEANDKDAKAIASTAPKSVQETPRTRRS